MNNPHGPIGATGPVPDAAVAADWLRGILHARRRIRIASIGPKGTSAHDVLNDLTGRFRPGDDALLQFELCSSFECAVQRVLDGEAEYALVPSAYTDATAFHWNPLLHLACVFVHRTPDYGLAVRTKALFPHSGELVVAAMPEVQSIFGQLAPDHLANRPHEFKTAMSTSHAAAIVGAGAAHIAVCNDLGRQEHDLAWISQREGTEIVWMLFERGKG